MSTDLNALGASMGYGQVTRAAKPDEKSAEGAGEVFKEAASEFSQVFDKADMAVEEMAKGEGSAQAVVQAMAEAELALQTAVTIRDRVVEAYQEILRMPL